MPARPVRTAPIVAVLILAAALAALVAVGAGSGRLTGPGARPLAARPAGTAHHSGRTSAAPRVPAPAAARGHRVGPAPAGARVQPLWLVLVLAALGAAGVVAVLVRLRRGRGGGPAWLAVRRGAPDPEGAVPATGETLDPAQAREQARRALADLDWEAGPREAVIGCWLRLEQAALAAGLVGGPGATAGSLGTRLLAAAGVDGDALTVLRERFERARFSPHPIGAEDWSAARAALREVTDQLRQPAGAGADSAP
jgi:hypothetical protein